jgi:VanZ family protein
MVSGASPPRGFFGSLWLWLAVLLAWAGLMAILSLSSGDAPQQLSLGWDKLNHVAAYTLLTLLLIVCLRALYRLTPRLLVTAWSVAFAYGLLLEGAQLGMQAGRTGEVGDLLANALGATLVCVIFWHRGRRSSRHER